MNLKLQYYSDVKDGRLQTNISRLIQQELPRFEGKRIEITMRKVRSKRSVQQNALFHAYVGMIAKELGYEFEEMKEIIKYKFLKREKVDERTGEVFEYIGQTSKLSKGDFSDLVASLQQWVAETFHIRLPDPGENWQIDYNDL